MPAERIGAGTFSANEDWRVWVDTLFETLGVSVIVADLVEGTIEYSGPRAACCDVPVSCVAGAAPVPECFADTPSPTSTEVTRVFCRAGLPCYFAPVVVAGRTACHVAVDGFVTSTRERRLLFERLASRVSEQEARAAVHGIAVFTHRRALALARMVATHASAVLTAEQRKVENSERVRELRAFVDGVRDFVETAIIDDRDVADAVLAHGMETVSAEEGSLMLLRHGSDILEVAAVRGENPTAAVGATCRVGEGVPGHVAETKRSMLIMGGPEGAWPSEGPGRVASVVAVPLVREGEIVGVLSLGFQGSGRRLSPSEIGSIEAYAKLAASALRSARQRADAARETGDLDRVNELARLLQGDLGFEGLMEAAARALDEGLEFAVAGVVVTGRGYDAATIAVRRAVSGVDLDAILEEAAGVPLGDVETPAFLPGAAEIDPEGDATAEWTVLSVPLAVRDVGIGAIFAAAPAAGSFDAACERLLVRLAEQLAPAFDRALLFDRLRDDYARTIAALSTALDASERRESGHSARVMDYAMAIGEEMGLDREEIELLRFAGLLHDIGKVGIAEEILLKPSKLTVEEMEIVRLHSQRGASLLEQVEFLNATAPIVLHHHERWDGEGYPMRLAGTEIPLLARILAVADSYDAMTCDTSYRRAMTRAEAMAEIQRGSGYQFDPETVAAFARVLERQTLAGATGLLSEAARRWPSLPS